MENNNNNVELYIRRVVTPIFNKFLQETTKNRVSVGGGRFSESKKLKICFYNPHNYRLYFDFFKYEFTPHKNDLTDPLGSVYLYRTLNHGKEHFYEGFLDCNITVKKNQIMVTPRNVKEYIINMNEDVHPQIIKAIVEKDEVCLKALRGFVECHGGKSSFQVKKRFVGHNKVIGEDAVNRIDSKLHFYNPIVKKVYNESNAEWSDPVFVVNYLRNRSIENIAPDIVLGLQAVLINQNPLAYLKSVVKIIDDVLVNKDLVGVLSLEEKRDFELWLFDKFGVSV
jgi:hypothetical protein